MYTVLIMNFFMNHLNDGMNVGETKMVCCSNMDEARKVISSNTEEYHETSSKELDYKMYYFDMDNFDEVYVKDRRHVIGVKILKCTPRNEAVL